MTPKRYHRLRKDVEATSKAWMRTQPKWGSALQMELGWLEGEQYEENKFVVSVFLGQLARKMKGQKPVKKWVS